MSFISLHGHSVYSFLDGASTIDEIVELAVREGMHSIAITDHGNTMGLLEFYQKAKKEGINPILGVEAYFHPVRRGIRELGAEERRRHHHLTILAKNYTGYKNILKLTSRANTEGFYFVPQIDDELLYEHREGLIVLSGCVAGYIPTLLRNGYYDVAKQQAEKYREWFGEDFYLEIMRHPINENTPQILLSADLIGAKEIDEEILSGIIQNQIELKKIQEASEAGLLELHKELGIPLVATNDAHYTCAQDAGVHDVLYAMSQGRKVLDSKRRWFATGDFYIKNEKEMLELFSDIPEAVHITDEIAKKCNVEISAFEDTKRGKYHFPKFDVPEGFTEISYLRHLAEEGWNRLIAGKKDEKTYRDRLEFELGVIERMGFPGIFLAVWDIVRFARENDIPVNIRGSGVGSLVLYLIGITILDPLEHGLLFERFLSPDRISLPDIDIDVSQRRRDEVIKYIKDKYGHDHVANIGTVSLMTCKSALKKVFTALGVPFKKANDFTAMIPDLNPEGKGITIDEALEIPRVKKKYEEDPEIRTVVDIARRIEKMPANVGVHAAGLVITPGPVWDYVAVRVDKDGNLVTQATMEELESIGLVKIDVLGVRTLDVIHDTAYAVKENHGIEIDVEALPLDDKATFDFYSEAKYMGGTFQTNSDLFKHYLRQYRPREFKDIVEMVALIRPGPLDAESPTGEGNMVDEMIRRRRGESPVVYPHESTVEALRDTLGIIVFQESVMQISRSVAGYTPGESDELRQIVGKKKMDKIPEQAEKFISGAIKNGVPEEDAQRIWEQIETFGRYGFNKSHSVSYAYTSYQTVYLKTHYPVEFMAALLTSVASDNSRVSEYLDECYNMGINVLPPDINISGNSFVADGNAIRFALSAIKGVGQGAVSEILKYRENYGAVKSIPHFVLNTDGRRITKTVYNALIHTGAFDSLGYHRALLSEVIPKIIEEKAKLRDRINKIFADQHLDHSELIEQERESFIRECEALLLQDVEPYTRKEMLEKEKELLGFYVSGNPVFYIKPYLERMANMFASHISPMNNGMSVVCGGVIMQTRRIKTRNGKTMAFLTLRDHTGVFDASIPPWLFDQFEDVVEEGVPVIMQGSISSYTRGGETQTRVDIRNIKVITEGDVEACKKEMYSQKENNKQDLSTDATNDSDNDEIDTEDKLFIMIDATSKKPIDEIGQVRRFLQSIKTESGDGMYPEIHCLFEDREMIIPLMFKVNKERAGMVKKMKGVVAVLGV